MPAPNPALSPKLALVDSEASVRLDLADAEGRVRRRARFDSSGLLRAFEVFDASGRPLWSASFDGYAPVDGVAFAHAVSLEVATGGTRAEITMKDVQLNPLLPPGLFRLRAPPPAAADEGG